MGDDRDDEGNKAGRLEGVFIMAHWWYRIRYSVLMPLVRQICSIKERNLILAPGCGGCADFEFLSQLGEVYGFDPNEELIKRCQEIWRDNVKVGWLPDNIPFVDRKFDLIFLLDVLEHLDDDKVALESLRPYLKDGGFLVVTVPAFMFLWGDTDIYHNHKRRYTLGQLKNLLEGSGYDIVYATYFNFFFFPFVFLLRKFQNLRRTVFRRCYVKSDTDVSFGILNNVLVFFGKIEGFLLRYIKFPFGVSIVVVGRGRKVRNNEGF